MKKYLTLMTLVATTLAGCTTPGNLYPVQGPLSKQYPSPIYPVAVSSIGGDPLGGSVTVTLQDGEVCSGRWAPISPSDSTASTMSSYLDTVYGTGFFVANVLGSSALSGATLTGTKGTVLSVQFKMSAGSRDGKGIATDNNGDVFKLTF